MPGERTGTGFRRVYRGPVLGTQRPLCARLAAAAFTAMLLVVFSPFPGAAATEETPAEQVDEFAEGRAVYESVCAACHQPDGRGVEGQFPPLVDNPNVADAAYLSDVIRNGREGEIVVDGVTYDGVMPAFATLSEADVDAVVDFVQNGFGAAAPAPVEPPPPVGGVAGTELPPAANVVGLLGRLLFAVVAAVVAAPWVFAKATGRELDGTRAWLKSGSIVLFFVLGTVYLPSLLLETGPISDAPRLVQDMVSSGVWLIMLVGGMIGLRWAQRERRI